MLLKLSVTVIDTLLYVPSANSAKVKVFVPLITAVELLLFEICKLVGDIETVPASLESNEKDGVLSLVGVVNPI